MRWEQLCVQPCFSGAVIGQGGHILRAIRTETHTEIEIPTRDDGGALRVYGTAEQRSRTERAAARGSLSAVSTDFAQSHISSLEFLAAEQPYCSAWPPCSSSQTLNIRCWTMTRKCTERTLATWRTTTQTAQHSMPTTLG